MARLDQTERTCAPGFSCQQWPRSRARIKHRMAS